MRPHIDLDAVDAWWRAANYLSAAQIYLRDNPLLERELTLEDLKPRLLGHWGTAPGLNLLWAHLNRLIVARGRRAMFVCGPGHGGPAVNANAWLDAEEGASSGSAWLLRRCSSRAEASKRFLDPETPVASSWTRTCQRPELRRRTVPPVCLRTLRATSSGQPDPNDPSMAQAVWRARIVKVVRRLTCASGGAGDRDRTGIISLEG